MGAVVELTTQSKEVIRFRVSVRPSLQKSAVTLDSLAGLVKVCIFHNQKMHFYLIALVFSPIYFLNCAYYFHVCLIDGAARIFSYLLCCDHESNSRQFSSTFFRDLYSRRFTDWAKMVATCLFLFFFCKFLHRSSFHRIKWNSVESNLLLVSFSWNIWLQKSFFLITSGFYVAHFSEKFYLFFLLFLRSPLSLLSKFKPKMVTFN